MSLQGWGAWQAQLRLRVCWSVSFHPSPGDESLALHAGQVDPGHSAQALDPDSDDSCAAKRPGVPGVSKTIEPRRFLITDRAYGTMGSL